MAQVRSIPWDDYELAIPAFLTIVLMPFTFSITNGIGAGFVSIVVLKSVRGRAGDLHWLLVVTALAFVVYFAIDPLERLLGIS
jgi:AGZA family xanthine/uracil permease-like MFS transporter